MLINLKELSKNAIETTSEMRKMRLSENAQSMVFQLFTKNVYSNPIGTVVREITSNCFDSHVEANVDLPVVIRKTVDETTNSIYISFIDFGVGMSPDRIYDIYGVYFESTKRTDNTQIGGFGIGGKTPLAYKRSTGSGDNEYDNSFYVITIYNGIKYYYCMFEGEDAPVISLLHQEPTTEGNGTEIRIPVLKNDMSTFVRELNKQLYYFENIVFEGFDYEMSNDYQIIRGKSFLYRGESYNTRMHICLGRVAYPIDYSALGLNSDDYILPIAIKLDVGSINVTVSREAIDYSESTKKLIINKLDEAKAEIVELLTKQYENVVGLEDYFQAKANFGMLYLTDKVKINTGKIIKQSDFVFTNFKYNDLKITNSSTLARFFIDSTTYGNRNYIKNFRCSLSEIIENERIFYVEDKFQRKVIKQSYLKEIYHGFIILSLKNFIHHSSCSELNEAFSTKLTPDMLKSHILEGKTHPILERLLELQLDFFDFIKKYREDYNTLVVPADFVNSKKKLKEISKDILTRKFSAKEGNSNYSREFQIGKLIKKRYKVYYSTKTDSVLYYDMYNICNISFNNLASTYDKKLGGVLFLMVSEVNAKILSKCDVFKPITEFPKDMLYRKEIETSDYFKALKITEKYDCLERLYRSNDFHLISPAWGKKIKTINDFIRKYKVESNKNRFVYDTIVKYKPNYKNFTYTFTEKKILKLIDDLIFLMEINKSTMRYINVPYSISEKDTDLINILKKIMVL